MQPTPPDYLGLGRERRAPSGASRFTSVIGGYMVSGRMSFSTSSCCRSHGFQSC